MLRAENSEILVNQKRKLEFVASHNRTLDFELLQDRKHNALLKNPALAKDLSHYKDQIEKYLRKNRLEELLIKETQQSIKVLSMREQSQKRAAGEFDSKRVFTCQ